MNHLFHELDCAVVRTHKNNVTGRPQQSVYPPAIVKTINHLQSSSSWLETCPWKPGGMQARRKPKVWQIYVFNNQEYMFPSRGFWKHLVSSTFLFILKELQAEQFCWLQHRCDWPIWYHLEAPLLYKPCNFFNSMLEVHADSWGTVCS